MSEVLSSGFQLASLDEQVFSLIEYFEDKEKDNSYFTVNKVLLDMWPFIFNILSTDSSSKSDWFVLVIVLTEKLIYLIKNFPLEFHKDNMKKLNKEISELNEKMGELVSNKIEEEKKTFFLTYGNIQSELHSAVDYWAVWESQLKLRYFKEIRERVKSLSLLLEEEEQKMTRIKQIEANLQENWSEIKSSLLMKCKVPLIDFPQKTMTSFFAEFQLPRKIDKKKLSEIKKFFNRLQTRRKTSNFTGEKNWQDLRALTTSLLHEECSFIGSLAKDDVLIVEGEDTSVFFLRNSVSILDTLLKLLKTKDSEEIFSEQLKRKHEISQCLSEMESLKTDGNEISTLMNYSQDSVFSKFLSDSKDVLAAAALQHIRDVEEEKFKTIKARTKARILELENELQILVKSTTSIYDEPWKEIFKSWSEFLEETKKSFDPRNSFLTAQNRRIK